MANGLNMGDLLAGHIITGAEATMMVDALNADLDDGGLYATRIVVKPANTTRASTTTVTADPDLTMSLKASATYEVVFHIWYEAITAAEIQTEWSVPTGLTSTNRSCLGPGSSAADTGADNISMHSGVHNYGTAVNYGSRNNAAAGLYATERSIVITGSTAGSVALAWAQNASSSTGTSMMAGSYMTVTRLA